MIPNRGGRLFTAIEQGTRLKFHLCDHMMNSLSAQQLLNTRVHAGDEDNQRKLWSNPTSSWTLNPKPLNPKPSSGLEWSNLTDLEGWDGDLMLLPAALRESLADDCDEARPPRDAGDATT